MNERTKQNAENIEDSIHIRAVRFGAARPNGFLYKEIREWYETKREEEWEIVKEFLHEASNNKHNSDSQRVTPFVLLKHASHPDEGIYTLSYEAAFNYLDLVELKETRKMANDANRTATNAIRLTILSMAIASVLTLWQIFIPESVDQNIYEYFSGNISKK